MTSEGTLRLGWFATGRGPGSRGLLTFIQERIIKGELPARILFVFCNREPGEHEGSDRFMSLVRHYDLPLITLSSRRFARERGKRFREVRPDYDSQVAELIAPYNPDVVMLAGYMLIVGPELCRRFTMLNLHPALPGGPAGTWQDVIWQLIEHRAEETGAMVHVATEEVDAGPVVGYFRLRLRGPAFDPLWREVEGQDIARLRQEQGEEHPLFRLIRQEEYRREPFLLLETLKAVARGEVRIEGYRVMDSEGKPLHGLDLTERIEQALGD